MNKFFNFGHWGTTCITLLLFSCTFLEAVERDFKVTYPLHADSNKNTLLTEKGCEFFRNFAEPNFTECSREKEIKEQLKFLNNPCAKIPLIEELFKIKLKTLENQGFSIDDFLQEAKERVTNDEYFICFEEAQDNIKSELFGLYHLLLHLTWDSTRMMYTSSGEFPLPFLHLFDFEQEAKFPLFGVRLLDEELATNSIVLIYLRWCTHDKNKWWEPFWSSKEIAIQSYWKPLLFFVKRLLIDIEDDQCTEVQYLKERVILTAMNCFDPKICELFPQVKKECDPLIHLFPYIIKYKPIEDIQDYFNKRFAHMAAWDREALWIDLHFRAVEAMTTFDLVKAYNYLEKAEVEIEKSFSAFPWSSNYSVCQEKRQKALELLNEWKKKLDSRDAN